ncbi:MAG: hypothetical protein PVJ43_05120 [Gemmatimonadales bacterium]|jgi:hypothetical protein
MKNRQALFLLAILTSLPLPRPVDAQTITSPYDFVDKKKDLGLFVGYMFADGGNAGLGPKDGPLAGVAFNIRVSDPIAVSFIGAYFPAERDVVDPAAEEANQRVVGTADLNLLLLTGHLNLQLTGSRTWHNITPYVYGGLGIAIETGGAPSCLPGATLHPECLLLPRERFDFGTSFVGQIGIGAMWLPRQRLGLRFTLDDSIWKLNTPVGFYDETSTIFPVPSATDWTNNFQLTAGLFFWF